MFNYEYTVTVNQVKSVVTLGKLLKWWKALHLKTTIKTGKTINNVICTLNVSIVRDLNTDGFTCNFQLEIRLNKLKLGRQKEKQQLGSCGVNSAEAETKAL